MPRPPDPKSKTNRLIIEAGNEDEKIKIQAFKRICMVDGLPYKKEVLKLVENWLQIHNWPPGNPQIQMTKFVEKQLVEKRCEHPGCTQIATWVDYPKPPAKPRVYHCPAHHKHSLENQLLKKSKPL